MKFVGRHILHKWLRDDSTKKTNWYSGVVLDTVKGKDFLIKHLKRKC